MRARIKNERVIIEGMKQLISATAQHTEFMPFDEQAKEKAATYRETPIDRPIYDTLASWPLRIQRGTVAGQGDVISVGDPDELGNRVVAYEFQDEKKTMRLHTYLSPVLYDACTIPVGGRMIIHCFAALVNQARGSGSLAVRTTLNDIVKDMGGKPSKGTREAAYKLLQTWMYTVITVTSRDGETEDAIHLMTRLRREGKAGSGNPTIYFRLNPDSAQSLLAIQEGKDPSEWSTPYVPILKRQKTLGMRSGRLVNYLSQFKVSRKKKRMPSNLGVKLIFEQIFGLAKTTRSKTGLKPQMQRLRNEVHEIEEAGWTCKWSHDKTRLAKVLKETRTEIQSEIGRLMFDTIFRAEASPWVLYEYIMTGAIRKDYSPVGDPPACAEYVKDWDRFCKRALKTLDFDKWVGHFLQAKAGNLRPGDAAKIEKKVVLNPELSGSKPELGGSKPELGGSKQTQKTISEMTQALANKLEAPK